MMMPAEEEKNRRRRKEEEKKRERKLWRGELDASWKCHFISVTWLLPRKYLFGDLLGSKCVDVYIFPFTMLLSCSLSLPIKPHNLHQSPPQKKFFSSEEPSLSIYLLQNKVNKCIKSKCITDCIQSLYQSDTSIYLLLLVGCFTYLLYLFFYAILIHLKF